jgi:preprotein translocase subunit Sec61beta
MNEQQLIGLCLLVGAVVIVAAFFAAGSAVW